MRFGPKFRSGERVSTWTEFGGRRGIVATGATSDTVSGGYRIIEFQSDGQIEVYDKPISVEYLIVGGGGGGAFGRDSIFDGAGFGYGGGGGGQVVTNIGSPTQISPGKYKIVVGAGGTSSSTANSMGQASIFNGVIAYGGGAGSVTPRGEKSQGWNGGGGSESDSGTSSTTYLPGEPLTFATTGFKGGMPDSQADAWGSGGGGAGAGAVGGNATANGGTGGAGVANSITGTSVNYGGGGGGGVGDGTGTAGTGTDGGGNGGKNAAGSNGTNGRGGGGGGAGANTSTALAGGNGGSGVVIIRYAV